LTTGPVTTAPDERRRAGWILARPPSFWLLGVLLGLFLAAASAPSPLYAVYKARWHFSAITLTAIFAVYAVALLAALLTTGRLSDHIGRRRVLVLALVIQIAGMVAFIAAEGVAMLYIARILQGVGTGIATGALGAWLLDLQPSNNPRLGSLVVGIAPQVGLAAGALGAGLLVQFGPDPLHLVFWLLTAVFALALVAMPFFVDLAESRPGWLQSMKPQVGVPPAARALFAASAPSLIGTWALGGLYLSLGPSVAISLLHTDSHLAGGLVIVALAGAGALASVLVGTADPRRLIVRGSLVLILGLAITLVAVATGTTAGLYIGSMIAGLGFGPSFLGVFRTLAPLAPPDRRSALVASIYVVSYLSFGIPAVIAGVGAAQFGLLQMTYVYGVVVIVLAAITTFAVSRRRA
jgi:predicted MFS family arabinose efflux permease